MTGGPDFRGGWRERVAALRNVPAVLRFVWESGRAVVVLGLISRVIASLVPPALFWVTKLIIDAIYRIVTTHQPTGTRLWWLVGAEFAIAVLAGLLNRAIDYLDALLAGKYMHHVSVRVMEHAAGLDLLAYEDPAFYDRLERARVQATDRLYMIQAIGRLVQQAITTITLSISIMLYSPWLLLMLIVGVIPAFVGETHFAFLGYAKNFRQTPVRRQLDYLRILGGSKEAAKELKLFGLKDFLTGRFQKLSTQVYEEDVALARRKLTMGSLLSAIGTAGYYTAYVFAVWKTVTGEFTLGTLTFLANAIRDASSNLQQTFSTLSTIADQALFLT
ncbi:MAG TPA: ABC transporter ATP-binding protein, partial [Candidatus Sulfotelmatobacter sp.]